MSDTVPRQDVVKQARSNVLKSPAVIAAALIVAAVIAFVAGSPFMYEGMRANYRARNDALNVMHAAQAMETTVDAAIASNSPIPPGQLDPLIRDIKSAELTQRGDIVIEVTDRVAPNGKLTFTRQPPPTEPRWKCHAEGFPSGQLPVECRD